MEGVGIVREQLRSKAALLLQLRRVGFRGLGREGFVAFHNDGLRFEELIAIPSF